MHWENVYRHFLIKGDICLDIGANEGLHSLIMKKIVGPEGKVYAFEPQPDQFRRLAEKERDGIVCIHAAMKGYEGNTKIYYSDEDGVSNKFGSSTTVVEDEPALQVQLKSKSIRSATVACTTVAAFCERENLLPDFLKIDTEGAETEIVRGGLSVIKKCRPILLFEYGSTPEKLHSELLDILTGCGYGFFIATLGIKNGERQKKEPSKFIGLNKNRLEGMAPALCDVLAVPEEKSNVPDRRIVAAFDDYFRPPGVLRRMFPFLAR